MKSSYDSRLSEKSRTQLLTLKIYRKTLCTFSYIQLTLTMLHWTYTWLLLGTSLLVTEYRTRMKLWLVKLGSQKLCMYSYFPEDTACAVLFKEMVSINNWHIIKLFRAIFEKIVILFLEPLFLELECSYSLGMDLWWINLEYQTWIKSIPPFRHKRGTRPSICIDGQHSRNH
jgi:hypothetical protein